MKVTALLVSHNGERWLPQVLAALDASTLRPDRVVAVDTGSDDGSVALVESALGSPVIGLPADTTYAAAVRAGLAALPAPDPEDWIWLLHDDSAPGQHCLERLTTAARVAAPEVAVVGPKLREWPSLKRLLEVGVTISGTGRRETGLETGEYDQGQHDDVGPVLAVNTAGMLVRHQVLAETGLADELPLFGNDIDLGWRLARQGQQVTVSPDAVMFHVEAAHRGRRRGVLTERPRRDERAAAVFTVLANGSSRAHPYRLLRLLVAGLLRSLGFLLVRAPAEAREELAALGVVYGHPGRLLAARRARRRAATVSDRDVRPLLAPVWMPWRHGLDFGIEVLRALVHVVREALGRRRGAQPSSRPLLTRLVRSPSVWAAVFFFVVALVASRDLLHGAPLHGGALWAVPDGVGHWWHTWVASWHWLGQGSAAPGPPYLLPLAVAGSVLFGQPGLVVWLLFCLTVPLTLLGALRFLRRVTVGGWAPVWGAAAYALLPVLSGSVSQGRLGTVVGAMVLPWAATAALGLADPSADRRARAVWRTALLVGLLTAFAPIVLGPVIILVLLAPRIGVPALRWTQRAALVVLPLLLVAPALPNLFAAPGIAFVEAGRAASVPVRPDLWHLLAGNSGGPGAAPAWITLGIAFAALVALVRVDTRTRVLRAWIVALLGALCVLVLARVEISLPGIPEPFRAWPGFAMLLVLGALVTAAALAADGALRVVAGASFGWRQPVAAIALLAAVMAPVVGTGWWLAHGTEGPLHRSAGARVPAYMVELASARHDNAAMVLRGGPGAGRQRAVSYQVLRPGVDYLGDDAVLAMTAPDSAVARAVTNLVGGGSATSASVLAANGIAYVFAPAPVSPAVAGALDASSGFASASAPNPHARAWRVVPHQSLTGVDSSGSLLHPWLLAVELLALLAGVVLAMPTRRAS
ncbi:glycosyltransferase [Nocardioides terrisoli]|uniref:glycosyltransferase n=1 Tax=Nocardioides terrisoli TaxID=3388267 RepID=UPI00287B92FD|nr:glycosyltransferase [Nocardioides marmorisolisilvae]